MLRILSVIKRIIAKLPLGLQRFFLSAASFLVEENKIKGFLEHNSFSSEIKDSKFNSLQTLLFSL